MAGRRGQRAAGRRPRLRGGSLAHPPGDDVRPRPAPRPPGRPARSRPSALAASHQWPPTRRAVPVATAAAGSHRMRQRVRRCPEPGQPGWTATAEVSGSVCGRTAPASRTSGQGGQAAGHLSSRQSAADTSLATCAGHQPSGQRSFRRRRRTANPMMVPARYNFLYSSSRPALRAAACGGHPRPAAPTTALRTHHRRRGEIRQMTDCGRRRAGPTSDSLIEPQG
jgi:hypothetical protein